jgi:hypothetical protein
VRRSSISIEIGKLREAGALASRGLRVADRRLLEKVACACYSEVKLGAALLWESLSEREIEVALDAEEALAREMVEGHLRAMERVPGYREQLRDLFGTVMPWEAGYVPRAARGGFVGGHRAR